jgi:uncharacterized membrane protein
MIKTIHYLMKSLRGYRKDVYLTWLFVALETLCEILIPFFMQFMVDSIHMTIDSTFTIDPSKYGNAIIWVAQTVHGWGGGTYDPYIYGALMAVMALLAAAAGVGAGYWAASAQRQALAKTFATICIIIFRIFPLITSINFRLLRSSPDSRPMLATFNLLSR